MRPFIFVTAMLLVFSCGTSSDRDFVEYREGRQLLTVNDIQRNGDKLDQPKVIKLSPDSISVGGDFSVKIFLDNHDFGLVAAYFDCDTSRMGTVDTTATAPYKVDGCKKRFEVKNDTIFIFFQGGTPGRKKFHEITILTRDKEKIYRTQQYIFDYVVTEN